MTAAYAAGNQGGAVDIGSNLYSCANALMVKVSSNSFFIFQWGQHPVLPTVSPGPGGQAIPEGTRPSAALRDSTKIRRFRAALKGRPTSEGTLLKMERETGFEPAT